MKKDSFVVQNILVIQLTKMGDLLQTTPLLQRIRDRYPEASLSLLVDEKNVELARGIPILSDVIGIDLSALKKTVDHPEWKLSRKYKELSRSLSDLTARDFDLIYNINFSKISGRLAQLFGKSRIIGYEIGNDDALVSREPWVSFIFHLMGNRKLLRVNLVDLLAGYERRIGPKPHGLIYNGKFRKGVPTDLFIPARKGPTIGLQIGCGGELRRWPVECFASLAIRLIQELGARIILFGSQTEVDLGRRFFQAWEKESPQKPEPHWVCNLIGKTTIPELATRLENIDLLVTADTGTMHLAAAVRTKILGLFMATASCHETGPYGDGHMVIQTDLPCHPCQGEDPPCPRPFCREMIQPKMVYETIKYILFPSSENGKKKIWESFNQRDSNVQLYRSSMDDWGVKFLPIIPRRARILDIMAGVYRELCRNLMDDSYSLSPETLNLELLNYYNGLDSETLSEVRIIREQIRALMSDFQTPAQSIRVFHPSLRPLINFLIEEKRKGGISHQGNRIIKKSHELINNSGILLTLNTDTDTL